MKSNTFLTLAAIGCSWWSLAAGVRAEEPSTVSLKIDLVALGDEIHGLRIKGAGADKEVLARPFQYSKEINYSGPRVMEIFQSFQAPDANSNASGEVASDIQEPTKSQIARPEQAGPVTRAVLPLNSKRVTILLATGDADGTYRAVVIDDDPTKLPAGQLRIHNYCPNTVMVRCNGIETKELAVGESCMVVPHQMQVVYELAYKVGESWKMQENNIVRVVENEQAQMIILKSGAGHFLSSNGGRSGFLQHAVLRRLPPRPGAAKRVPLR